MGYVFLELDEVLRIHADQIERYGGAPGLRDLHLLNSALAMPRAGIGERYLHEDVFEMAAAYLFHIARDHPFVDGNKRVGAAAAVVFLEMNGIELNAGEKAFENIVRAAAEGKTDKAEIADFFRKSARF